MTNQLYKTDHNNTELTVEDAPEAVLIYEKEITNLERKKDIALKKAKNGKELAEIAKGKSAGWFKKKAAIEALQDAGLSQSDALIAITDALQIFFEFQQRLANVSKNLLRISVSNIATTRTISRNLQLRLQEADEEEISELARQEMIAVVHELKRQEDIWNNQEKLKERLTNSETLIEQQRQKQSMQHNLLEHHEAYHETYNEFIDQQLKNNKTNEKVNKNLEQQIKKQHKNLLNEQKARTKAIDKQIKEQTHIQKEINSLNAALTKEQDERLETDHYLENLLLEAQLEQVKLATTIREVYDELNKETEKNHANIVHLEKLEETHFNENVANINQLEQTLTTTKAEQIKHNEKSDNEINKWKKVAITGVVLGSLSLITNITLLFI